MKAVTFHGERDVRVEEKGKPEILEPTDAILRVTTSAIWAKRSIDSGVFSSGLRTMEFPAARAGPTFQSDRANG